MTSADEQPALVIPLGVFGPTRAAGGFDLTAGVLKPLVGLLDSETRRNVGQYLEVRDAVMPLMEYTHDVLEGRFGVTGGTSLLSDGTYYWRRDAAEYVRNYGIGIPRDMIDHMRNKDWKAPEVDHASAMAIEAYLSEALNFREMQPRTLPPRKPKP